MEFFKKLFGKEEPVDETAAADEDLGDALLRLQRSYWSPAPQEKAQLAQRFAALDWRELFRLHHLVCVDLLHAAGLTAKPSVGALERMLRAPVGPDAELCVKTATRLLLPESPYRSRRAFVFHRRAGVPLSQRSPEHKGELRNTSITHLGALEVICLDAQQKPSKVDFVPFGAIRSVNFGPPSLFPPARLDYEEEGRSDVAWLPLLYGPSWFSQEPTDQDGSTTRFVCHTARLPAGVGLGHQDFTAGTSVFGLGSLEAVEFPLDASAPDFDERCRKRGFDPAEIRKKVIESK